MLFYRPFLIASATSLLTFTCAAKTPQSSPTPPSYQERIMRMVRGSTAAWTADQIATMGRLRDAAIQDSYALTELRHLTAELLHWPGQTPGTTRKIVLTALGGSGATPADGLRAEVLAVNSFDDLNRLPPDAAQGKMLLFNEKFDK